MRKSAVLLSSACAAVATMMILSGCAATGGAPAGTWKSVQPVLERNCVHCHGTERLAHMPAMTDTAVLAGFAESGRWIVPGKPESSRFFQVVVLTDVQPGAMPPSGHAVSPKEVETLRAWIANGAPVPAVTVPLVPKTEGPRSR